MKVNAYLSFDGQCEAALTFYATCLGAPITMMVPYAEAPTGTETPPAMRDKIMHGRLMVGDSVLMGSDAPPGHFHKTQGCMINVNTEDVAEAERVFAALAEGGSIQMPIAQTFWAHRFGMLTDKFGVPWMVNCEAPPPAEQ